MEIEFEKKCACKGSNLDRFIQPIILLSLIDCERNGYGIIKQMEEYHIFGNRKPDAAGVYRYLKLMENKELIASTPCDDGDRTKRIYHITPRGKSCLQNWKKTLVEYKIGINEIIAEIEGLE